MDVGLKKIASAEEKFHSNGGCGHLSVWLPFSSQPSVHFLFLSLESHTMVSVYEAVNSGVPQDRH